MAFLATSPFENIYIILGFSVALLAIGIYGLTSKQNMIKFLIAIELLLDAAHLNFIAFSNVFGGSVDPLPHAVVILSICVGGCVAGVALALIIQGYRIHATLNSRRLNQLRY